MIRQSCVFFPLHYRLCLLFVVTKQEELSHTPSSRDTEAMFTSMMRKSGQLMNTEE